MPVTVTKNGLDIDGQLYPLHSGSAHYWRLEREVWPLMMDRFIEMGFRFLSTYVPWSVHELEKGSFDFGEEDTRKDLDAFLRLCKIKGLFVLLRPGPHINAKLTFFGYPERIFNTKDLLSRTAEGTPAIVPAPPRFFPAPSYASTLFYDEVAGWFDAVCPIIRKHLYPDGPVVGVQADNEMGFFFRTHPFDQDYSDAAVKLYRDFLRKRHGSIAALCETYGHNYPDFSVIPPPREFKAASTSDYPYYLDWLEFKEFLIYYGIKRISDMLRLRGIEDVFLYHNFAGFPTSPMHVPGTEAAVDVAGADLYCDKREYDRLRDTARFLAGTSRMPFIPELGAGGFLWYKPLTLDDQIFANRAVLMNGVKAVNHYMLTDRDRWYGAPVARNGRKRKSRFDFYTELNRFLDKTGFHEFEMQADAVLLCMRDYERFEQVSALVPPPLSREVTGGIPLDWFCTHTPLNGLREPVAALYRRQWRELRRGFREAGYTLALADSDIPQEELEKYKLIVVPSFEFMGKGLQKRLLIHALKGGTIVLGPRVPVLDEYMAPYSKFSTHLHQPIGYADEFNYNGMLLQRVDFFKSQHPFMQSGEKTCAYERALERGAIIFLGFVFQDYTGIERAPHVADIARRLCERAGIERRFPTDDPLVETVLHQRGTDRLLFVANPTAAARNPKLDLYPGQKLTDWHNGEIFDTRYANIELPPYAIRILTVR